MAGLKDIKLKIESVKKTGKVTRAMEAVSAVKMRKSQERALAARPYARAALTVLASVAGTKVSDSHPLMREGGTGAGQGKVAILIITSDKGLAGSLNSAVIKQVERFIQAQQLVREDVIFLCLGKRGYEFAATRKYEIAYEQTNISDDVSEADVRQITDILVDLKTSDAIREARIAYTDFKSTFEQQAALHKILPLSKKIISHIVDGIAPARGKYANVATPHERDVREYTVEPDATTVLNALLPRLVNIAVHHKLMESKASEHSARMVAMKNATDKSKEVAKSLNLKYNKARQAAITREVSEIVGGIEAMK